MTPARARRQQGRGPGAGSARWLASLGVLLVLVLAIMAGFGLLTLFRADEPGAGSPSHPEIDETSRERLVEILREEGDSGGNAP